MQRRGTAGEGKINIAINEDIRHEILISYERFLGKMSNEKYWRGDNMQEHTEAACLVGRDQNHLKYSNRS
jgi:hypothetical protein